jgi:hypothetical protein
VLSFDLSGKGGRTSNYATAGITHWIIAPHKPSYPQKKKQKLNGSYKEGHERKKPT